jgi:hypothetical protein
LPIAFTKLTKILKLKKLKPSENLIIHWKIECILKTIDEFIPSDALITTSRDIKQMWPNIEYKELILINHYAMMYKNGMVAWPKAFDARLKTLCSIRRNAIAERVITKQRSEMVDITRVNIFILLFFFI